MPGYFFNNNATSTYIGEINTSSTNSSVIYFGHGIKKTMLFETDVPKVAEYLYYQTFPKLLLDTRQGHYNNVLSTLRSEHLCKKNIFSHIVSFITNIESNNSLATEIRKIAPSFTPGNSSDTQKVAMYILKNYFHLFEKLYIRKYGLGC